MYIYMCHILENTVDIASTVDFSKKSVEIEFFRELEKKDHWPMVPSVVRYGPGRRSTKKSWSHVWWEMVPTRIRTSSPIHRFIDPVDRSRSISTVDAKSLTGEYGRYRRSMPIHLRRITVDGRWSIKNRHNFVVDFIDDTCGIFPSR